MSYDLVFSFYKAMASNCKKLITTDLKRATPCQYRNRVFQTIYKLNLQRRRDIGHVAEEPPCTKNSDPFHTVSSVAWPTWCRFHTAVASRDIASARLVARKTAPSYAKQQKQTKICYNQEFTTHANATVKNKTDTTTKLIVWASHFCWTKEASSNTPQPIYLNTKNTNEVYLSSTNIWNCTQQAGIDVVTI